MPGRLSDLVTGPVAPAGLTALTLVHAAAPATPGEFPTGLVARSVDATGRLRPNLPSGTLADTLGWQPGVLGTTLIDGWLALIQQPDHVGAPRGRSNHRAGFTVTPGAGERIGLRPAHLAGLAAGPSTLLLLAAVPDERALIIVNPLQLARLAPPHVQQLIGIAPERHLNAVPTPATTEEVI